MSPLQKCLSIFEKKGHRTIFIFIKRVPEAQDGGVEDVGAPGVGEVGGRGPETPA